MEGKSMPDTTMEKSLQVKRIKGRLFLLLLFGLFLIAEFFFSLEVVINGNGDIFASFIKSVVFSLFIFLYYKRFSWAKWILSILLILISAGCFLGGFEQSSLILKIIGCFYFYFGLIVHFSSNLQAITYKMKVNEEIFGLDPTPAPVNAEGFIRNNKEYIYPRLLKRYQAVLIDGLFGLLVIVTSLLATSGLAYGSRLTAIIYVIVAFSYEPVFTAYSSTLGQKAMGIRVRKFNDPEQRLSLWQAYLRFFAKGLLGWLSFITINFNKEHRAIHDLLASSVVIKNEI